MKDSPCPHWVNRAGLTTDVIRCFAMTFAVTSRPEYICYTSIEEIVFSEATGVTEVVTDPPGVRTSYLEEGEV